MSHGHLHCSRKAVRYVANGGHEGREPLKAIGRPVNRFRDDNIARIEAASRKHGGLQAGSPERDNTLEPYSKG